MTMDSIQNVLSGNVSSMAVLAKAMSTYTGFDREDADTGGKSLGILQFCFSASSGEVHQLGSDEAGVYTKLTAQTHFADGTALVDRTFMQFRDTGETAFTYWHHGALVTNTDAKFIQVAADFKGYIGYNEAGDLDDTITDVRELIVRTPLVGYIYLNQTEGEFVWYGDERHGTVMSGQTHLEQHQKQKGGGFFLSKGLDIHGIVNNGTTWTSIEAGGGGDEDIKMFFDAIATAPKIFMEGAASEWRITDDDNKFGIFRLSKVCYNDITGTPSLLEINADRVVMTAMATQNKLAPVVWLVGQKLHATRGLARAKAASDYWRIKTNGLPSQEFCPIGSVIVNSEANGTAEVGADTEIWYDHRFADSIMRFTGDND